MIDDASLTDSELDAFAAISPAAATLVAEVRRLRRERADVRRAAQHLVNLCPRPEDERSRQIRDEAIGIINSLPTARDEWLQRAAEEINNQIAFLDGLHPSRRDMVLKVLRKHRDGMA